MSTVNHVQIPNIAPAVANAQFNQVWKLTRGMKKAGWKYKASGNGTTTNVTGDPALDLWNSDSITNVGGAAASIATPSRGRALITGLNSISSADKGRLLTLTGGATAANNHHHQIEEVISSTSVKIDARNFAVVADANNGALTWTIRDPTGGAYPTALDGVSAWILFQGPAIIKIPIVNPTSATMFFRGENVIQASSGFEGEIKGYLFDTGSNLGFISVAPRLRGTGVGLFGLTTGQVITGSLSGASITQTGTAQSLVYEQVFWKSTTQTSGTMYIGQFDTVADATDMFSDATRLAATTATVAPGGAAAGANTFPSFAWTVAGTAGAATHSGWANTTAGGVVTVGNAQVCCADLIEEQNYSADGSWWIWMANTATAGFGGQGFAFQALDDTEDGELSPYISFNTQSGITLYSGSRTVSIATAGSTDVFGVPAVTATRVLYRGWRRRGLSGDGTGGYQDFEAAFLSLSQTNINVLSNVNSENEKLATSPIVVKTREPIWIISSTLSRKMRKGTLRYMYLVQGGVSLDLLDNGQFIQLGIAAPAIVAGPWSNTVAIATGA